MVNIEDFLVTNQLTIEDKQEILAHRKAPCSRCPIQSTCTYGKMCGRYKLWKDQVYLKKGREKIK